MENPGGVRRAERTAEQRTERGDALGGHRAEAVDVLREGSAGCERCDEEAAAIVERAGLLDRQHTGNAVEPPRRGALASEGGAMVGIEDLHRHRRPVHASPSAVDRGRASAREPGEVLIALHQRRWRGAVGRLVGWVAQR